MIKNKQLDQVLIFTKTKRNADYLTKYLSDNDITSLAIHGDRNQSQRLQALNSFKDGHIKALVATDVAARGIDIDSLACVINFELPKNPEDYIHRIGRTGRAGEKGYAISLVSSDDHTTLGSIEELLKTTIKKENGSDLLPKKLVVSSDTKNISIQKPRRSNPKAVKDLLFSQPYVPKNTSAKNDALCGAPINQNSINNGARNRFNRPIPALFFSFATNKQQKDE